MYQGDAGCNEQKNERTNERNVQCRRRTAKARSLHCTRAVRSRHQLSATTEKLIRSNDTGVLLFSLLFLVYSVRMFYRFGFLHLCSATVSSSFRLGYVSHVTRGHGWILVGSLNVRQSIHLSLLWPVDDPVGVMCRNCGRVGG